MSHSVTGAGSPGIAPDVFQQVMGVAQAMDMQDAEELGYLPGDTVAPPSARVGSAPTTSVLGAGDAPAAPQQPPELIVTENGQIYGPDNQPYLGLTLFLREDAEGNQWVVDGQENEVDFAALEAQAYGGTTAPADANPSGVPQEFGIAENGQLLGPDNQPYLGQALFVRQDAQGRQAVFDAAGTPVDLAALEAAAASQPAAPATPLPAPPQYFKGANDQLVDANQQPYLGVTMFLKADAQGQPILIDAQGQAVDLDALIAANGYDVNLEPVAPQAPAPVGPEGTYTYTDPTAPAASGGGSGAGVYVRNLGAAAVDMWRRKTGTTPPPTPDTPLDNAVVRKAGRRTTPKTKTNASTASVAAKKVKRTTLVEPAVTIPGGRRKVPVGKAVTPTTVGRVKRNAKGQFVSASKATSKTPPAGSTVVPVRTGVIRNAKGQFVSPKDATPPAAGTRTLPLRDAKGRFIKATPPAQLRDAKGRFIAKDAPAIMQRDAKGRFVAKTSTNQTPAAGTHTVPLRDASGRFVAKTKTTGTPPVAGARSVTVQPLRDANGRFVKAVKSVEFPGKTVSTKKASSIKSTAATKKTPAALSKAKTGKTTASAASVKAGAAKGGTTSPSRMTAVTGRILPALLLANDGYNIYQGVKHWDDAGNDRKWDDALRIGGSGISAFGSGKALHSGNLKTAVSTHLAGLAINTLGNILNDQD